MNDLPFAIKSLRRSPGFTLIAIVTLALGIGANTSMFSILNGYMLAPVPYPDSDRLNRIYRATAQNSRGGISPADYLDLKSQVNGYGEIAAWGILDMSLSEPGQPAETPFGLRISANLFSSLGSEPQLGRSFRPDEEISGNHRVLIISHRYWQNRFGGEAHIIGRTVRVDGESHEIVGVLPASSATGVIWAGSTSSGHSRSPKRKSPTVTPPGSAWSGAAPAHSPTRKPKASSRTSVAASLPTSPPPTPKAPGARSRSSRP